MQIRTRVDRPFSIELEGKRGGGYVWEPELPGEIELSKHDVVPARNLGGGGEDRFEFRVKAPGQYELRMHLKRPWESKPVETRTFKVVAT
jgi:predicted secreted protein